MKKMKRRNRVPSKKEIRAAEAIMRLSIEEQGAHPSSVPADHEKLAHVRCVDSLPKFYIDVVFKCRLCGLPGIWKARSQKYYYEELKKHIYAKAVECANCRDKKRRKDGPDDRGFGKK